MTEPAETDPNGPKPTVAQARAAWEAHASPSLNNVMVALQSAGFTGTVRSTLYRWHKKGWPESVRRGGWQRSPPQAAAVIKEVTDKVLTDEQAAAAKALAAFEAEVAELRTLAPPPTTLDEAKRIDALIADIMLARRIQRFAVDLVLSKDGAKFFEALKSAANVAEAPANTIVEPKIVAGIVIEHEKSLSELSPLQKSIREFRSQQLKVVK